MADRNELGHFQKGHSITSAGVARPAARRNFKTVMKAVIESYTEEEIINLIKCLPENQQLHFLDSFTKSQQQHIQFLQKLQLEREKLNTGTPEGGTIVISLPTDEASDEASE
jgi:hypothetical protein